MAIGAFGRAGGCIVRGQYVVISAVKFTRSGPETSITGVKAVEASCHPVVGRAGTLPDDDGVGPFKAPDFPAADKVKAAGRAAFVDLLRAERFAPAASGWATTRH